MRQKFKPLLKFIGIFFVTEIVLILLAFIAGVLAMFFHIDLYVDWESMGTSMETLIQDIFIFVPILVAWKFRLVDLSCEFQKGKETFSLMALPILAGVLWFLGCTYRLRRIFTKVLDLDTQCLV